MDQDEILVIDREPAPIRKVDRKGLLGLLMLKDLLDNRHGLTAASVPPSDPRRVSAYQPLPRCDPVWLPYRS